MTLLSFSLLISVYLGIIGASLWFALSLTMQAVLYMQVKYAHVLLASALVITITTCSCRLLTEVCVLHMCVMLCLLPSKMQGGQDCRQEV
jgi:hypothetical protein